MRPGQQLGHYRVLAELGHGGMGAVFAAEDERLRRMVALKLARGDAGETGRRRLLREARAAAALRHPNVAAIYDVGEVDGAVYIAMELIEGHSLRHRLAAGPLALAEALRIAREIAAGMAHLHAAGVIHRDLKPENVMLDDDGRVRLVDFGLAKQVGLPAATESGSVTRDGDLLGTPSYMAPEQAEGREVDHRCDVFAFGAVLYELVTGRRAFAGSSAMQVLAAVLRDTPPPPPGLPADLARLIERCLEKLPEDRLRDFHVIGDALALVRLEGHQRGEPPPVVPGERPSPAASPAPVVETPTEPASAWALTEPAPAPSAVASTGSVAGESAGPWSTTAAAAAPTAARRRRRQLLAAGTAVVGGVTAVVVAAKLTLHPTKPPPAPAPWQPEVAELARVHDERASHLALSPDGRTLAYASERGGAVQIFLEPTGGGAAGAGLSLPVPTGNPADLRWTRDGRALLYVGGGRLYRLPVDGGPAAAVRDSFTADDCGGGRLLSAEPAPARCPGCARLVLVDPGGGERELLQLPAREYPWQARCDARGARAAVQVHRPALSKMDIQLVDVARPGGEAPVVVRVHERSLTAFALDGARDTLIYARGGGRRSNLFETTLDGARTRQLTTGAGFEARPDVALDGGTLAYIQDQTSQLLVARTGDGPPITLAASWYPYYQLVLTPDGRELIATRVDADTRAQEVVAFATGGGASAGEARVLYAGRPWDVTPDGRDLIVSGAIDGKRSVGLVALAGGPPRRLTVVPEESVRDARMGADGRVHFTVRSAGRFVARSIGLDGGEAIDDAPAPFGLVVPLASGHRLAEVGGGDAVRALRVVAPGALLADPGAPELRVDEFVIVGGAVVYRPAGGGPLRRYQPATGADEALALTPTGSDFAVAADLGTVYYAGLGGTARPQLIAGFGRRPPL
jgi:hypothetical protein